MAEPRGRDSLHTMSDISPSKLPEGKVLMWQMYFPSSETSVLVMTRDESKVGSLLLKRTRRDHGPNATDREWKGERCGGRKLKAHVRKDVTQKIKSSKFKTDLRVSFVAFSSIHMPALVLEITITFWAFSSQSYPACVTLTVGVSRSPQINQKRRNQK